MQGQEPELAVDTPQHDARCIRGSTSPVAARKNRSSREAGRRHVTVQRHHLSSKPLTSWSVYARVQNAARHDHGGDRVSLALGQSEAMCLVGESGCGKTTTGRLLAGLLRPTSGQLLYEGKDVWTTKGDELARFRRSVQLVHQDPYASLNPIRTVYQTLSAPLFRPKKAKNRRAAVGAATELLQRVGLTPPADFLVKYPHQLSGGQRQRVSIARALSVDPRVIVADEAVSMVDVSIRISLLNLLLALRDEFRVTIVLITHDLAVARYFARRGRIGVMYLGARELARPSSSSATRHIRTRGARGGHPEADRRSRDRRARRATQREVPSLLGCRALHVPSAIPCREGLCDVKVLSCCRSPTGARSPAMSRPRTCARRGASECAKWTLGSSAATSHWRSHPGGRTDDPAVPEPRLRQLRVTVLAVIVALLFIAATWLFARWSGPACRPKKMTNKRRTGYNGPSRAHRLTP